MLPTLWMRTLRHRGHFVALVPLEGGTQEASRGVSRRPQGRSGENILSIRGASFAKPQN